MKGKLGTIITENQKKCSKCQELKDFVEFRPHIKHSTGYRSQCRKCENTSRGYDTSRPRTRTYKQSSTHNSEYKKSILKHYGETCFCCGENNISLLCVDHINDNGKEHGTGKKNGRYKGIALYRFLVKNNYPDGIQIACFNCNIGRRINKGECPHKGEKANA